MLQDCRMSFFNARWKLSPPPPQSHLDRFVGVDPFLVQVLYHRGVTEPDDVRAFLDHRLVHSDDPFLLTGMDAAVSRVRRAIQAGESIVVYGDYDADGVTASVLLVEALRGLGAARVQPYIPDRIDEGYGLNNDALSQLAEQGNSLVITVDCGVRAVQQIQHANQQGLDVIVTDHHTVGTALPPAAAVIDPKQPGDQYPDPSLAGVGLAFKLVQGLTRSGLALQGMVEEELLDLVALGTVADLAPLLHENRVLVHRGLEIINQARRPGIAALLNRSGIRPGEVTATTIGYVLGPRINAAGRLAHAYHAARLLITNRPDEAHHLAGQLGDLNRTRQDKTHEMTQLAASLAVTEDAAPPLLFAAHPDFPPGIVGLIASRLMESHYRPAVAAHIGGDVTVASCRSIPEFHITEALEQCQEMLVKFGGHAAAAGFTVTTDKLSALQEKLVGIAREQLSGRRLTPTLHIDLQLPLAQVSWQAYQALAELEPCGYANPTPLLASPKVKVVHARPVGQDGSHLKLTLEDGGRQMDAIAFRMGDKLDQLQGQMDVVYHLETNTWNGQTSLQLNVQDMRPAGEDQP